MEKTHRADFKIERNEEWFRLNTEEGWSFNRIQSSPEHNPEGLTVQRIHQVVKDFRERKTNG